MNLVNYKGYTKEMACQRVGIGWASLINEVFNKLESITGTIRIIQVKEKYAGLRIYTDYHNDVFQNFLTDVEYRSFTICETCGAPGMVRGKNWYYTSCDAHAKCGDEPCKNQPNINR